MLVKLFKKYYLQDSLIGAAYEGLCSEARGWVKKSIACLYNFYGQPWPAKENIQLTKFQNSSITLKQQPCELCVVIYDSNYKALSRGLAAVCPALFAGVQNICTLAVHEQTVNVEAKNLKSNINSEAYFNNFASQSFPNAKLSLNLLAAWELAGVEDMLALPQADLLPLLHKVQKHFRFVRIVVLGNPAWKHEVLTMPLRQECKIWTESPLVNILMRGNFSKKTIQAVKALHPDLRIKTMPDLAASPDGYFAVIQGQNEDEWKEAQKCQASGQFLDANIELVKPVYSGEFDSACASSPLLSHFLLNSPSSPSLVLDKNMAGCWLWPDLGLDFFKANQVTFTA